MTLKVRQEICFRDEYFSKTIGRHQTMEINNDMMRLNKMKYQLTIEKPRVSEDKKHEYENQR
jgi:hypothetical protein